jgi:hypothetical protein
MITLPHILLFMAGLLYGCGIGFLGYKVMNTASMKAELTNKREIQAMKRRLVVRWWIRLMIDAVGLFVLYKVVPMLLGAALGIILFHKLLIVKYIKK